MVDAAVDFDNWWDLVAYSPRALAIAYLAPFPWQWAFTQGHTGVLRPMAAIEIVLIALLFPAVVIGCCQRVRRFRPEEWVLMVFIGVMALALGFVMVNAGILFRLRLMFLFPSLILASSALPAFAYRIIDRFAPSAEAPVINRRVA